MRLLPAWLMAVGMLGMAAAAAEEAARPAAPVGIVLEATQPPRLQETTTVQLRITWTGTTPAERSPAVGAALEVTLHLPPGFAYVEGPLQPVSATPQARDPTGPWSTYRWSGQVTEVMVAQESVVALPVTIRATEPGENWVITAAVQGTHGATAWQEHAVLFATVSTAEGTFHTAPRFPATAPPPPPSEAR